jgi:hypothetical protein
VATSIAAFAGTAPQGSIDEAVLVQSWSDFQTEFGGLVAGNYLGYSVNQFFANGGQQAYIVRVAPSDVKTADSSQATTPFTIGGLKLYASSPGLWGDNLLITTALAPDGVHFSILVQLVSTTGGATQTLENFYNLSLSTTDPNYVVPIINNDSQYVSFLAQGSTTPPTPTTTTLTPTSAMQLKGGSDGTAIAVNDGAFETQLTSTTGGVSLLSQVPIFNLLCVPGEAEGGTISQLQAFCATYRAFLIVDAPLSASYTSLNTAHGPDPTIITAPNAANSAYYFPWISAQDPLFGNRPTLLPPCGFVAGIYAATDANRGVWKAPAGIDAGLTGALGLQFNLTDLQNGALNTLGINCLREFRTYGNVVWGARTLLGNDAVGSQWKYVPIRRFALFLESSLYEGTQWVVFEPNDEALWGQIRLNVGSFMQQLFLQGAFQGTTPQQAYFVKCDAENNPQASINQGIVNILVGFAPLYPAEFVVIQIQQIAGQ